jgi:dUTPase
MSRYSVPSVCEFLFYELLSKTALRPEQEGYKFLLKSPISITIPKKSHVLIDLFLRLLVPSQIHPNLIPRIGLSSKNCIELGDGENNASDSLKIKLYNHSSTDYLIERGTVIAELICVPVYNPQLFSSYNGNTSCTCRKE